MGLHVQMMKRAVLEMAVELHRRGEIGFCSSGIREIDTPPNARLVVYVVRELVFTSLF